MLLWAIVVTLILIGYAYWAKPTPTLQDPSFKSNNGRLEGRRLSHPLCASGLIYLLGAGYALAMRQFDMGVLLFMTWGSSLCYHIAHEARFFNIDFLFANSVAIVFLWVMALATPAELRYSFGPYLDSSATTICQPAEAYVQIGLVTCPFALALFVWCGQPADIVTLGGGEKIGGEKTDASFCCRVDSEIYLKIHPLWHIVSGLAPLLCIHYFSTQCTQVDGYTMGLPDLNLHVLPTLSFHVPTLPSVALITSAALNIVANSVGIMPLK
jgi:hypothetical protein